MDPFCTLWNSHRVSSPCLRRRSQRLPDTVSPRDASPVGRSGIFTPGLLLWRSAGPVILRISAKEEALFERKLTDGSWTIEATAYVRNRGVHTFAVLPTSAPAASTSDGKASAPGVTAYAAPPAGCGRLEKTRSIRHSASAETTLQVEDVHDSALKIAVIGVPNSGKSTLVNSLLEEQRMICEYG